VAPAPEDDPLLDLVGELVGLLDLEELRAGLLTALQRVAPSKYVSLNELGPDGVVVVMVPDVEARWFELFADLAHENPLYQRWLETKDARAYRFSDVTTPAALRATALYREVYEPLGVEHQIAFTLQGANDTTVAIALSRGDRDYTDAERDLLNRARPFLVQIYRNALDYAQLLSQTPQGVVKVLIEHGLTAREAQIAALVVRGLSYDAVADQLGLSGRTIEKHIERSFRKLGVHTRSEAAARIWELGAFTAAMRPNVE
jgi:DNA-binding CsgD family transcriptional regulator